MESQLQRSASVSARRQAVLVPAAEKVGPDGAAKEPARALTSRACPANGAVLPIQALELALAVFF